MNEEGLEFFSLTDHDSLSGIEQIFRCMEKCNGRIGVKTKHFIPGIELSLFDQDSGLTVHMTGYFPRANMTNYRIELQKIDAVVG